MKEIQYQELTSDRFRRYGSFSSMIDPEGPHIGEQPLEFFRDRIQCVLNGNTAASLSVVRITKRPFIITTTEFHSSTSELQLPIDGDVLFHVAPATSEEEFPGDAAEVFRIPRGTSIVIHPGVWHHGPFTLDGEPVHSAVLLPERAYYNDTFVIDLPKEQQIKISGKGL